MKKQLILLMLTIMIPSLTACSGTWIGGKAPGTQTVPSAPIISSYDTDDLTGSQEDTIRTVISFEGDSAAVDGNGVSVSGTVVSITSAGTYSLRGVLNDGQVIVNTKDSGTVKLILDGTKITSSSGAPLYVANADKAVITLADGSQNTLSDGAIYTYPEENEGPDAAVFSNADLTFNGNGALTVNANYRDGIASEKELKVVSGTIAVNAVNDGVKGKDSVSIKDGAITINAGADGIQSTNADKPGKGYILIEDGVINITSGLDGIQAETNLQVHAGELAITSGGGESSTGKPGGSTKGLKAGLDLVIKGGTFDIRSADDSIHANDSVTVDEGIIQMASRKNGIHADEILTINGGEINLTQSYEGLESAMIFVNGGNIHMKTSDDGINASGGGDSSSTSAGRDHIYINGGYIFIDASGDGIDSNGTFEMTAGVMLINGPTDNRNGPLDYDDTFTLRGGFLVAVGSSGMAKAPSDTSTQFSVLYNFDAMQAPGTLLHIQSQRGQDILTYMPAKGYQSVAISSPALQNGETYLVYTGGDATGTVTDGLYTGGVYTPGVQVATFTISSMITMIDAAGSENGNPPP